MAPTRGAYIFYFPITHHPHPQSSQTRLMQQRTPATVVGDDAIVVNPTKSGTRLVGQSSERTLSCSPTICRAKGAKKTKKQKNMWAPQAPLPPRQHCVAPQAHCSPPTTTTTNHDKPQAICRRRRRPTPQKKYVGVPTGTPLSHRRRHSLGVTPRMRLKNFVSTA